MWQALLLVSPATVTFTFAALLLTAGAASKFFLHGSFSRSHARIVLTALSVIYIFALLVDFDPVADKEGGPPEIQWNPLYFIDDLKAQNETVEHFSQSLPNGSVAFYSPEKDRVEEERTSTRDADFFVHGAPEDLTIRDNQGQEVGDQEGRFIERHMGEAVERNEQTESHEALTIEEKVMNLLLFVPIGIVATYCFSSVFFRFSYGPFLSFAVEGLQWFASGGNVVDSSDIGANSLGSWIGCSFAIGFIFLWYRRASHRGEFNTHEAEK